MTFVNLFLEVVGNFFKFLILLLDVVPEFFDVLMVLQFLEFPNFSLKFLDLHFLPAYFLLKVLVVLVGQFEVFFQGVDFDCVVLYLGFVFGELDLVAVVDVPVLLLLLVGEVEFGLKAEEFPVIVINNFLHFLALLLELDDFLLEQLLHYRQFCHLLHFHLLSYLLSLNHYMLRNCIMFENPEILTIFPQGVQFLLLLVQAGLQLGVLVFEFFFLIFNFLDVAFLEEDVSFEDDELGMQGGCLFLLLLQCQAQLGGLSLLLERGQMQSYPLFFSFLQQRSQSVDEFVAVQEVRVERALSFLLDEDVFLNKFAMRLGELLLEFADFGFFEVELGIFLSELALESFDFALVPQFFEERGLFDHNSFIVLVLIALKIDYIRAVPHKQAATSPPRFYNPSSFHPAHPSLYIYTHAMKSFSNDLSPINLKSHAKDYLFEQFLPKAEPKDASSLSHSLSTLNLGTPFIEQKIVSTAKTIVYLFSPDIDLLERLQQNIQNYDKYQKTKMLLRELFSSFNGSQIQNEVMKTTEGIVKLQWQIEQLSSGFSQLQAQNRAKDEQIDKYRNSIIELSKAYEEAKIYFMDEILEHKYEIEELKSTIEQGAKREGSKSKSKLKKVTLNVPKDNRLNNSEAFTDRSIYKRFTASQIRGEQNHNDQDHHNNAVGTSSFSATRQLIQKHQFQKENLQRKIMDLQANIRKLEQQNMALKSQYQTETKQLSKKVRVLEQQVREKSSRLKEKNKTICELLDNFEGLKSKDNK